MLSTVRPCDRYDVVAYGSTEAGNAGSGTQKIVAAIRTAAGGGAFFDPHIAHIVIGRIGAPRHVGEADSQLTVRERRSCG
jgi:DNA-binding NarL/FixJ family response regulator